MKNMEKALQSSGYTPTTVTTETMKELFGNSKFITSGTYYAMDFEEVPRQLSKRKMFLRQGTAYIHEDSLGSFLLSHFEDDLREGIALFSSKQYQFLDPRIEETMKQLTVVVDDAMSVDVV